MYGCVYVELRVCVCVRVGLRVWLVEHVRVCVYVVVCGFVYLFVHVGVYVCV